MSRRSTKGEGSIRQRKSGKLKGRWRVQFDYDDPESGERVNVDKHFISHAEGLSFLQELKAKVKLGHRVQEVQSKRETTLGEFFEFLVEKEWPNRIANQTLGARRGRYRKYWKAKWGNVSLLRIDPMKVRDWYGELETTIGLSLTKEIRTDLVGVLNEAKSPFQKVPFTLANPFALTVKSPPRRDAYSLLPKEIRGASSRLHGEHLTRFALHALGGLRFSEVRAVGIDQIRWDEGFILIDRAIRTEFNGREALGLPKGDKVRRAVMCPSLARILRAHIDQWEESSFLFRAHRADKWKTKKVSYGDWADLLELAELPPDLDTHDLRLSHINWLKQVASDVDDVTLKLHVGHEVSGVTEVNYTRALSAAEKKLSRAIEREFGVLSPKKPKAKA